MYYDRKCKVDVGKTQHIYNKVNRVSITECIIADMYAYLRLATCYVSAS